MRYIAKKTDKKNEYRVSGVKPLPTEDGTEVEVIIDTITIDKVKLEQMINDFKEETKTMNETREEQLNELVKELEAIEECK